MEPSFIKPRSVEELRAADALEFEEERLLDRYDDLTWLIGDKAD